MQLIQIPSIYLVEKMKNSETESTKDLGENTGELGDSEQAIFG